MGDMWYYARNGQSQGPVSWEQLQQLATSGSLLADDLVWRDGMPNWVAAGTIPGLTAPGPAPMQPTYPAQVVPPAPAPLSYYTPPKRTPADDGELSGVDWVIIVLCAGIGCIIGIIRLIQGKPSGGKMLGYSLLSAVIWNIISYAIRSAMH